MMRKVNAMLIMIIAIFLGGCKTIAWDKPVDVSKESKSLASQLKNNRVYFEREDIDLGNSWHHVQNDIAPPLEKFFSDSNVQVIPSYQAQPGDIKISYYWTKGKRQGGGVNAELVDSTLAGLVCVGTALSAGIIPCYQNFELVLSVNAKRNNKTLFKSEYSATGSSVFSWIVLLMPYPMDESEMKQNLENKLIKDIESDEVFN